MDLSNLDLSQLGNTGILVFFLWNMMDKQGKILQELVKSINDMRLIVERCKKNEK